MSHKQKNNNNNNSIVSSWSSFIWNRPKAYNLFCVLYYYQDFSRM